MSRRVHVALFEDGAELVAAANACSRLRIPIVDAYLPFPVHGLDEAMGLRRSRLPLVCFGGGLVGLSLGLALQYWTSAVDWPLNVGGKPFQSFPAFVPVAFELMVLCAGLATAGALFVRSRLLPGHVGVVVDPRVSDDRFVLVVAPAGASIRAADLRALLMEHGAIECREQIVTDRHVEARS